MYEYIHGTLSDITPATATVECHGVGYLLEITLNTYSAIKDMREVKLLVHEVLREDAHLLYGFLTAEERNMFRHLISVNGIGPATARMVLSTFSHEELHSIIATQNAKQIQKVKGVGPKAAQRIVLELHDKIGGAEAATLSNLIAANMAFDEAQAALLMLGFAKPAVEKTLQKLSQDKANSTLPVEEIIKKALTLL